MANMNMTAEQIDESQKSLRQHWETAHSLWNDLVSRGFERDYVAPIGSQLQAVQGEMERLAQVIAQARRMVH